MTDANVVLHRIPPGVALGGTLEMDEEAARKAVGTIAEQLGMGVEEAAEAILEIVNENMHAALRVVSVERGHDPRNFGLVAFGGAGPMHANALGRLIRSRSVIVPPTPGVMSAFGFLYLGHPERVPGDLPPRRRRDAGPRAEGDDRGAHLAGRRVARRRGRRGGRQAVRPVRRLPLLPAEHPDPLPLRAGRAAGRRQRLPARTVRGGAPAALQLRPARLAAGDRHRPRRRARHDQGRKPPGKRGRSRGGRLGRGHAQRAGLFRRRVDGDPHLRPRKLRPGNAVAGPAVVVQDDTTTVIEPGYAGAVDRFGNILIEEA